MDADKDDDGRGAKLIDESKRYTGTVNRYNSKRGFGTIDPDDKIANYPPKKELFVHWKDIQSNDDWPTLKEGMSVSFYLGQREGNDDPNQKYFAASVTNADGSEITVDEEDGQEKTWLDRDGRFSGTVSKFFLGKGFGFITLSEDVTLGGKTIKSGDIYVSRECIQTTQTPPALMPGSTVQFTIYKTKRGYAAGDVTDENGDSIEVDLQKIANINKKAATGKRKRQQGGGGGFGGNFQAKRQRFGPGGRDNLWKKIRCQVNGKDVGAIIGKKGANIKQINAETKCKLDFGAGQGEGPRLVTITGPKHKIAHAICKMTRKVVEINEYSKWKVVILVEQKYWGAIIGKKGVTIKAINGGDGKVQLNKDPLDVVGIGVFKGLNFFGDEDGVKACVGRAVQKLMQFYEKFDDDEGGGGGRMQMMGQNMGMGMGMANMMPMAMMGGGRRQPQIAMPVMAQPVQRHNPRVGGQRQNNRGNNNMFGGGNMNQNTQMAAMQQVIMQQQKQLQQMQMMNNMMPMMQMGANMMQGRPTVGFGNFGGGGNWNRKKGGKRKSNW